MGTVSLLRMLGKSAPRAKSLAGLWEKVLNKSARTAFSLGTTGHDMTELGSHSPFAPAGVGESLFSLTGGQCREEHLVGTSLVMLGIGSTLPTGGR